MKTAPVTKILTTNCTIVEAKAPIQTIHEIFDYLPYRFLSVVSEEKFVGVILREEFFHKYLTSQDAPLSAKDLISKEMVNLFTHNTIEEAKEIFDTKVFDVLPVTNEWGDLSGILFRDAVEAAYHNPFSNSLEKVSGHLRKVMSLFSF